MFTINDIATRWGVDRRTVKKEIDKGNLKHFTTGTKKKPFYLIREDWLLEFENKGGSKCQ